MKVHEVIKQLKEMNPEDDVVLKSIEPNITEPSIMKNIRVYNWNGRVTIDGYDREE